MAASKLPTQGQKLATQQLQDIACASKTAFEIVEIRAPSTEGDSILVRVSLDTSDYALADGGFQFRAREPIWINIPARFPLDPPAAHFAHMRFKGRPHVQWGQFICLFQAIEVEWSATDGMFGFVRRLDQWLRDAALNQLDPNDAPLHPPVAYTSADKRIVIELDPPSSAEGDHYWLGTAKLKERNSSCYDLIEWAGLPNELPKTEKYAAALLLDQPMPMEYPNTVLGLISTLKQRGVPFNELFLIITTFSLFQENEDHLYFILGAPMRRRATGEPLRHHLTAWRIEPKFVKALREIVIGDSDNFDSAWELVAEWANDAKTEWCPILDNRPEVTFRRDADAHSSWFLGKSVAILGCGAIGSHIGEFVTRAGAKKIRLVDNSVVKPGVLVRQQFINWAVGYSKHGALGVELKAINPKADIDHCFANLTRGWPEKLEIDDFDLVIDATASRRVASALQLHFWDRQNLPPILRCAISSNASHGIATLRMKEAPIGLADSIRQAKLVASLSTDLEEFLEEFWPEEQHGHGFQPEPGCSEPTFVGSAADVAFFASTFFNFAAEALGQGRKDTVPALYLRRPGGLERQRSLVSRVVNLGKAKVGTEVVHDYRVLISQDAHKAICAEISSNSRNGDELSETGGLLFGEIDDSLSTVYVDTASGAPPDSTRSSESFLCGVKGTKEANDFHIRRTRGSTAFIGVWHTHPISMPEPSEVDLAAMAQILRMQEKAPRHTCMLIVGLAASEPIWRFHLFRRNQFHLVHGTPHVDQDDD